MKITAIPLGELEANCYVVEGAGSRALVIDPGADAPTLLSFLKTHRLAVAAYLLTHGHTDHVSALAEMHRAHPAPVAIHELDLSWAFTKANHYLPFYPSPSHPSGEMRPLQDGQEWDDAGCQYRVMGTPGHTPGSVCFHFTDQRVLFTGDTLFAGSVGRTDLAGGDEAHMAKSLARLCALPDDTRVYPGHGPGTTIGEEERSNPFLQRRG